MDKSTRTAGLAFAGILTIVCCGLIIWVATEIYKSLNSNEGFYPRRVWSPEYQDWMWGWRRNWLFDWGNWRPNAYNPAYSGYWKQCPSGSWCPPYKSCLAPECS